MEKEQTFELPFNKINPYFCLVKKINTKYFNANSLTYGYELEYFTFNQLQKNNIIKSLKINFNEKFDLKQYDSSICNSDNDTIINKNEKDQYINNYKNEFKRVSYIYNKFIEIYLNPSNYKIAHLSLKCRNRKERTSYCNINESLNILKHNKNHIIANINKICNKHNIYTTLNNSHVNQSFIILLCFNMFNKYFLFLEYLINYLNNENNITQEYIYEVDNSTFNIENTLITIKNLNIIDNIIIKNNNTNNTNNINNTNNTNNNNTNNNINEQFIIFRQTPKRNDVYFK